MISLGPLVMGMILQELTAAPDFCSGACLLACWPPHSTEGSGLWLHLGRYVRCAAQCLALAQSAELSR